MKKGGSKTKYVSKGERRNVSNSVRAAMRRHSNVKGDPLNILNAYLNGKNPWIVIDNPNKEETNKRKIKVRASDMYGKLKDRRPYMIGTR